MSLEDSEDDFSLASEAEDDDDDNGDDDKIVVSKKRKVSTKEPSSNKKSTTKKVATSSSTPAAPFSNLKTVAKSSAMTAAASSSSSSSAPATGGLPPMAKGVGVGISVEEDITRGPDVHTEAAAKQLIMRYMMKENRPYSAIQIYDNLHHRIQKSTLEKCLNTLTESYTTAPNGAKQRLLCKEYGKAKIYYPDQNCFEVMSERELEQLSAEIEKLTQDADKAQKRDREVNARIAALLAEPSDDDIDREIQEQEERVEAKRQQIAKIKGAGPVDPRAMEKAIKEFNSTRLLWRDRKIACLDALEVIADGMNKKIKVVMGDMGNDGDEDVGVALPPAIPEIKRQ